MKKRIETVMRLQEAIEKGKRIVNCRGNTLDVVSLMFNTQTGKIDPEVFAEEPDPEPPRYVYRELDWEKKFYPIVTVQELQGRPVLRLAHIGTGHWENGREYRLSEFTNSKDEYEPGAKFPYWEDEGKMRYARFELQKETE